MRIAGRRSVWSDVVWFVGCTGSNLRYAVFVLGLRDHSILQRIVQRLNPLPVRLREFEHRCTVQVDGNENRGQPDEGDETQQMSSSDFHGSVPASLWLRRRA